MYNASAKDANATIIKRTDLDLPFFVESKGYVFFSNNNKRRLLYAYAGMREGERERISEDLVLVACFFLKNRNGFVFFY